MKEYIQQRVLEIGEYVVANNATVRATAEIFGISKSTVHYDVSKRLKKLDVKLYEEAKTVLGINFAERHVRGGESTKRKYENQSACKKKNTK